MDYHLKAPPEAQALYTALNTLRSRLRDEIDAHLETHGPSVPYTLDDGLMEAHLTRFRALVDASGVAYTNPDLLLGVSERGIQVVLGDVHAMPFLTPAAYSAAPEAREVWTETGAFLARLAAPATPALPVYSRRSFVGYEPDFGAIALEVDGVGPAPLSRRGAMADLQISQGANGFVFHATTYDGTRHEVMPFTRSANLASRYTENITRAARVYPVRLLDLGAWLAAPGWRTEDALPRLSWGDLVLHRRRFTVAAEAWASSGDPYDAFRRLEAITEGALPRLAFFKADDQPKPILVDFANPVSAEFAYRVARRSDRLTLVEMLPGPDALWLHGPGGTYTSELRTVFVRGA